MQTKPKYKLIQIQTTDEKGNISVESFPESNMIITGDYIVITASETFQNDGEIVNESAGTIFPLSIVKKFKTQY